MQGSCQRCGQHRLLASVDFKQNISFFIQRHEREFSGYLCFGCMSIRFAAFEVATLLGTWWGMIGCILGPIFIFQNLLEYIAGAFTIARNLFKAAASEEGNAATAVSPRVVTSALSDIENYPATHFADSLLFLFKVDGASTLIHSEGQRWLIQLLSDAEHELAPESLRARALATLKYAGVSRPTELTKVHIDKILNRFEEYLLSNTAPNREIGQVFLEYKSWLKRTYEIISNSAGASIHNDIQDWYKRVLCIPDHDAVIVPDQTRPALASRESAAETTCLGT